MRSTGGHHHNRVGKDSSSTLVTTLPPDGFMMQSKSHSRTWMVIAVLACLGPLVNVAQSSPVLFFTAPIGQQSGSDAMASGSLGGYSFSGEFCLDASCQGGPTGSTMRLTSVSLTCTSPVGESGSCGPVDIRFEADGFSSFDIVRVDLILDGTGSASGSAGICLAVGEQICPSDLHGSRSSFVNFNGPIAGAAGPVSFGTGGLTFNVLGGFHLDGLAVNNNVVLSDSFKITLEASTGAGTPVPEPMTALLLAFGLVSLIVLRKAIRTGV